MHELHCYDYVNQPYEMVRDAVLADPRALFEAATSTHSAAHLHVRIGALELGADIVIDILGVKSEAKAEPGERPTTTLELAWRSERRAGLFPIMKANLVIYPLTPTETQLELGGSYEPPLGVVGEAVDAVALHRFANASVQSFIREIATHLRRTLAPHETASA